MWNLKRLSDDVRGKVDRPEIDQLRRDLAEWRDHQDEMHMENRGRLDRILESIAMGRIAERR